jgi:hypothetical protein
LSPAPPASAGLTSPAQAAWRGFRRSRGCRGLFASTAYKIYGQKMVDGSYDQVGSPITVGLKTPS